jgi:DNA-binding transcriptional ArsR family regulator
MGDDKAEIDRVFHALGDPTRRRILMMLSERPHSVKGLAEPLGITLTAVAQQLQLLEKAGLVGTEKIGRVRTCRIDPAGLALAGRWIEACRPIWSRRLDRLGDFLEEEGEGPER